MTSSENRAFSGSNQFEMKAIGWVLIQFGHRDRNAEDDDKKTNREKAVICLEDTCTRQGSQGSLPPEARRSSEGLSP
jgi:hypothetical protein